MILITLFSTIFTIFVYKIYKVFEKREDNNSHIEITSSSLSITNENNNNNNENDIVLNKEEVKNNNSNNTQQLLESNVVTEIPKESKVIFTPTLFDLLPSEILMNILFYLIGDSINLKNLQDLKKYLMELQLNYKTNLEELENKYLNKYIPPIENLFTFKSWIKFIKTLPFWADNNFELNYILTKHYNYFTKILYLKMSKPLLNKEFVTGDIYPNQAQLMTDLQKLILKEERGLYIFDSDTITLNPRWDYDPIEELKEYPVKEIEEYQFKFFEERLKKLEIINEKELNIEDLLFTKLCQLSLEMYKYFDNCFEGSVVNNSLPLETMDEKYFCKPLEKNNYFNIFKPKLKNQKDEIINNNNTYGIILNCESFVSEWNQIFCDELIAKNNFIVLNLDFKEMAGRNFTKIFENIKFPENIELLSITLKLPYLTFGITANTAFFIPENFIFLNVKYLRIFIDSDGIKYIDFERNFYCKLLQHKHFPKLIHLSICGIENNNILFDCDILSQLMTLDIRNSTDYEINRKYYSEEDNYYILKVITKIGKNYPLLKHLILFSDIDFRNSYFISYEMLQNIYLETKKYNFVYSISTASISEYYYYSCYE